MWMYDVAEVGKTGSSERIASVWTATSDVSLYTKHGGHCSDRFIRTKQKTLEATTASRIDETPRQDSIICSGPRPSSS